MATGPTGFDYEAALNNALSPLNRLGEFQVSQALQRQRRQQELQDVLDSRAYSDKVRKENRSDQLQDRAHQEDREELIHKRNRGEMLTDREQERAEGYAKEIRQQQWEYAKADTERGWRQLDADQAEQRAEDRMLAQRTLATADDLGVNPFDAKTGKKRPWSEVRGEFEAGAKRKLSGYNDQEKLLASRAASITSGIHNAINQKADKQTIDTAVRTTISDPSIAGMLTTKQREGLISGSLTPDAVYKQLSDDYIFSKKGAITNASTFYQKYMEEVNKKLAITQQFDISRLSRDLQEIDREKLDLTKTKYDFIQRHGGYLPPGQQRDVQSEFPSGNMSGADSYNDVVSGVPAAIIDDKLGLAVPNPKASPKNQPPPAGDDAPPTVKTPPLPIDMNAPAEGSRSVVGGLTGIAGKILSPLVKTGEFASNTFDRWNRGQTYIGSDLAEMDAKHALGAGLYTFGNKSLNPTPADMIRRKELEAKLAEARSFDTSPDYNDPVTDKDWMGVIGIDSPMPPSEAARPITREQIAAGIADRNQRMAEQGAVPMPPTANGAPPVPNTEVTPSRAKAALNLVEQRLGTSDMGVRQKASELAKRDGFTEDQLHDMAVRALNPTSPDVASLTKLRGYFSKATNGAISAEIPAGVIPTPSTPDPAQAPQAPIPMPEPAGPIEPKRRSELPPIPMPEPAGPKMPVVQNPSQALPPIAMSEPAGPIEHLSDDDLVAAGKALKDRGLSEEEVLRTLSDAIDNPGGTGYQMVRKLLRLIQLTK